MSKTAVAVLEPEVLAPAVEASWDRARQLVSEIGDWHKFIELSRVLRALRDEYFRPKDENLMRGKTRENANVSPSSARGTRSENGWCEIVRRELLMSPQAALRAMEKGMDTEKIVSVIEMPVVEYENSRGEIKRVVPTPEMRQKAREALLEIQLGANAGRVWAGLIGEGTRVGRRGTPDRAEVDHGKNIKAGILKLKTSLPHWKRLKPEVRFEIDKLWAEINALVQQTWEMS